MTRREAATIIQAMLAGKRDYDRSRHFLENCAEERFTAQDINPILRSHYMKDAPEKMASGAHRVRLIGKCLEGRETLMVIDLRHEGPCALVSIMVNKVSTKRRRAR